MAGLTDQQKKTLQLDKHISVTANAGSGKTRVLVERYIEAVKGGVGVEEILCLTFTEKAALELRQKITDRIGAEFLSLKRNRGVPGQISLLREAKRKMLESNISTIHSFCSQVLREFPIEAGVDANFKVLEDFDASSLKEESCDEAIREALAEERKEHGRFHHFLVRIGYKRTLALLNELLDNREKIEHIKVTGHPLLMDAGLVRHHWKNLSEAVLKIVFDNVQLKKGNPQTEISSLSKILADSESGLSDILIGLKSVLDKVFTKEGKPRSGVTIGGSGDSYSILRTAHSALSDFSTDRNGKSTVEYLRLLSTLMELYEKSVGNYARKKFSMSALDFDDLQIRTMELLREKTEVRNVLTSRFEHIMVDEFQDTNFLQYDIFLNLLDNFAGDAKLFVVGDPKQSIYRFRNAQVEVSLETEEDLSKLPDGAALSLVESFRMNTELAGFVNGIFAGVMKSDRLLDVVGLSSVSQIEYKALVPMRPDGENNSVEVYVASKDQQNESSTAGDSGRQASEISPGESQAIFVASRIKQMIDDGEEVRDVRQGERRRRVAYGDIAVLLRSRSRLALLEEALSKKGVPYVVTSGIGFYSAQEIFDLTNYLTFLLDNNSDIALFTILRSPFFGISENELYRISLYKEETLFERLCSFAGSEKASAEVKYAVAVIDEETQLAHRLTIPQLINRILERTGWLGAYRLSPTGGQRIENMRKLLSIAREFEGRGFNNLYDFVERIKYLKDTAREGQASVEETVDAVRIMTVHAAKGLEFPVVIVPFCDATMRAREGVIVSDRVGVLPFIQNEVPPELSIYREFEKQNEQAELARLFYVACTRAMDKLILTTSPKKAKTGTMRSFADVLSQSFDLSSPPTSGYYEYAGGKIRAFGEVPVMRSGLETGDRKQEAGNRLQEIRVGEIFLDPIPADIDGEIYSATLLQTFKLCPTKYFLRYRLGMPAPDSPKDRFIKKAASSEFAEYDDSILATVRGELIHATLQNVLSEKKYDEAFIVGSAEHVINSHFGKNGNGQGTAKLTDQIVENVRNTLTTLHNITNLEKVYLEQTITRKFGNDFLTGTLDLLVEDENGFHIFDYKTNRLDRPETEIYAEYEIQMKLYASLCSQLALSGVEGLKTGQKDFDVTIIFTREAGKYLKKTYSKKDLEDFENDLTSMLKTIKSIEPDGGAYPSGLPTSTPHCHECEYFVGEVQRNCLMERE